MFDKLNSLQTQIQEDLITLLGEELSPWIMDTVCQIVVDRFEEVLW